MFLDMLFGVSYRAKKILKAVKAEKEMPVDLLEWRFLIPPRHVYRALMFNRDLEDAAGWAKKAIQEDEAYKHVEALESFKKAKAYLEEAEWFKNASDDEVDQRIAQHYCRWVLLGGRPIYIA